MHVSKDFNLPISAGYEVRVEYTEDFIIFHLPRVDKFTPGVYKDMVVRLDDFWQFAKTVGYKGIFVAFDPNNVKINKLVESLGFQFLNYGDGDKVYIYRGE
jgi:hypothetical protein